MAQHDKLQNYYPLETTDSLYIFGDFSFIYLLFQGYLVTCDHYDY